MLKHARSKSGVETAVNKILIKNITLFESMIRHLNEFPIMKQMLHAILFQGSDFAYNPDTKEINLVCMFGYAVNSNGKVQIITRAYKDYERRHVGIRKIVNQIS